MKPIVEFLLSRDNTKTLSIDENSSTNELVEWTKEMGVEFFFDTFIPYTTEKYKGSPICIRKKDLFVIRIWKDENLRKVTRNSVKHWTFQWINKGDDDLDAKSINFETAVEAMTDIINGIIKDQSEYE